MREAGDLSSWMKTLHRIAVDAKGYVWRAYDEGEYWSMAPTNPDNSPIPRPVTYYVPEALPREVPLLERSWPWTVLAVLLAYVSGRTVR